MSDNETNSELVRWKRIAPGIYNSTDGRYELTFIPASWEIIDLTMDTVAAFETKADAQAAVKAREP